MGGGKKSNNSIAIDNSLHDLLQLQVDELFIKDKKGNEK